MNLKACQAYDMYSKNHYIFRDAAVCLTVYWGAENFNSPCHIVDVKTLTIVLTHEICTQSWHLRVSLSFSGIVTMTNHNSRELEIIQFERVLCFRSALL